MNRKDFLKHAGLTGLSFGLLNKNVLQKQVVSSPPDCVLIPAETAGPFPLDLTDNAFFLRQDIREDRAGTEVKLKMRVLGVDNCEPMPNVRVHIWHCDKDGNYSGYGTEEGTTYLRGYQLADANGDVEFTTILPGWYPGRVCHIHFQVYVSQTYAATSQFTFEHDAVNAIYNENPTDYTKGEDPLTPETDFAFTDGYEHQLASLVFNEDTQMYESFLEVSIEGEGTVGVSHYEQQARKLVQIDQSYPNPFKGTCHIPIELFTSAAVKISLWSLNGQLVETVFEEQLSSGPHRIPISILGLGLTPQHFIYQVEVMKDGQVFRIPKMMTYGG